LEAITPFLTLSLSIFMVMFINIYLAVKRLINSTEEVAVMASKESVVETKNKVRIHINREPYESNNPTTGEALYELGKISAHLELFREVEGNREDVPVLKDAAKINLEKDEHFYSEKVFKIIVNAQPKSVEKNKLTFAEVVELAFNPPPIGPNILFTITYRKGPKENPEGSLLEGKTVKIKDGMIFNVTQTDKS